MNGRKKGISFGSALLIVGLIVLWRLGTFDQALVNVGLNAKPCIRNGFGATFCGSAAKEYCQSLGSESGPCASFAEPSAAHMGPNGETIVEATPEGR
jgi:hypothetical protein